MSVCSSGISQQKPGTTDDIMLTELLLQGAVLSRAPWLSPFIGYASSKIILHLPTFCAVDPPADPGVTAADVLGLIALGPGPLTNGAALKVEQLIERLAWDYFCECATGTLTPPAPVTAPVGLPAIDPGGYVPPVQYTPCQVADFPTAVDLEADDSLIRGVLDFAGKNATSARVTGSSDVDPIDGGPVITLDLVWSSNIDSVQTILHDDTFTIPETGPFSFTALVPTGANFLDTELLADSGTGTSSIVIKTELFCDGQTPGGTVTPCCPPDPSLLAYLSQILGVVTLIQRQNAPFAYVFGPVHSGLSGTGTIDVQGVLGLLLNTSVPDRAGRDAGTPVQVFECGWINLATDDGYTERFFVANDSQLIIPRAAGIFTHIGYTFPDDVTCTVTELLREP